MLSDPFYNNFIYLKTISSLDKTLINNTGPKVLLLKS